MGKRKRQFANARYSYSDVMADKKIKKMNNTIDPTSLQFDICCLTYLPLKDVYVCPDGYSFQKDAIEKYLETTDKHPFLDKKLNLNDLIKPHFTINENGVRSDPLTGKPLGAFSKIVVNKKNGNVYDYDTVQKYNIQAGMMLDLLDGEPFELSDLIVIHDSKRELNLPQYPIVDLRKAKKETTAQTNAKKLIQILNIQQDKEIVDESWPYTRQTGQSLNLAIGLKVNPPLAKTQIKLKTSIGIIEIELDSDKTTLGVLNMIGHIGRGSYRNCKVSKIDRGKSFEIKSSALVDDTVWGAPIALEKNDFRRGKQFVVYLISNKDHLMQTASFGISKDPLPVDQYYVIGGVVSGEGFLLQIISGQVFPNGTPVKAIYIEDIELTQNPFPKQ